MVMGLRIVLAVSSIFLGTILALPASELIINRTASDLEVINEGLTVVKEVAVSMCEENKMIYNLTTGVNKNISFDPVSDCSLKVNVSFENAQMQTADLGYLTNGFVYHQKVFLRDNKIFFDKPVITSDSKYFEIIFCKIILSVIFAMSIYLVLKVFIIRKKV